MEIKEARVKSEACTELLSSASCAVVSEAVTVAKDRPSYQEAKEIVADSSGCAIKSETVVTSVDAISNWRTDPMAVPLLKPTIASTSDKTLIAAKPPQRNKKTIRNLIEADSMLKSTAGKEFTLSGSDGQQTASIAKAAMPKSLGGLVDSVTSEVLNSGGSTLAGKVSKKISGPAKKLRQRQARINTLIRCTACNNQIGTTSASDALEHPVLKVLICRKCHKWYSSAEIVRGADGKDEQCRWCSEGGDLVCCDFCHNSICKGCIRRNLGRKSLMDILNTDEDSKWSCYVCDPAPIFHLVEQCRAILEATSPNVCNEGNLGQGYVRERIKKKEARPKTNAISSMLPPAAVTNTMPPTCYLPLFEPRQQALSSGFVRTIGSLSPMANVQQTIATPSAANVASVYSVFPSRETSADARLVAARASLAGPVEVINELMLASSSRLKLLVLLSEELSSAGQRCSSLESMPTLAKERRKIAEHLWATHNGYLRFFRDVLQRLGPTAQSVDVPKYRRAAAASSAAAARGDDVAMSSASKESILHWMTSPTVQNSLAANSPALPPYRDVLSVSKAALLGRGTITAGNSRSDQKKQGAEEQPEILFAMDRGRKRKRPQLLF